MSEPVVVKHNKLFKQIRHAWHFWFAVNFVFTEQYRGICIACLTT
ncbi:TPA: DUF3265 domain-containing protein [Vibrio parahaemolyticus]|nr:DUF3265 domain-containing protein [Vibrio parahaemolyticus]HCG6962731.1 DUF3265 domain-containing protein [Vibrio parahaemolyticus]HCM0793335.1 DUF3265 domain-containing protein [Vibrio parahaemolyticus]